MANRHNRPPELDISPTRSGEDGAPPSARTPRSAQTRERDARGRFTPRTSIAQESQLAGDGSQVAPSPRVARRPSSANDEGGPGTSPRTLRRNSMVSTGGETPAVRRSRRNSVATAVTEAPVISQGNNSNALAAVQEESHTAADAVAGRSMREEAREVADAEPSRVVEPATDRDSHQPPASQDSEPDAMEGVSFQPLAQYGNALSAEGESYLAEVGAQMIGERPWRRTPSYAHDAAAAWAHVHRCLLALCREPESRSLYELFNLWNDLLWSQRQQQDYPFDTVRWHLAITEATRHYTAGSDDANTHTLLAGIANNLRQIASQSQFPASYRSAALDWGLGIDRWSSGNANGETSSVLPGFRSVHAAGAHSYLAANNKVYFVDRGQRSGQHGHIVGLRKQGHGHQFIVGFTTGTLNHYLLIKASYFGRGTYNQFKALNDDPSINPRDKVSELKTESRAFLSHKAFGQMSIGGVASLFEEPESRGQMTWRVRGPVSLVLVSFDHATTHWCSLSDLKARFGSELVQDEVAQWRDEARQEDLGSFRFYSESRQTTPARSNGRGSRSRESPIRNRSGRSPTQDFEPQRTEEATQQQSESVNNDRSTDALQSQVQQLMELVTNQGAMMQRLAAELSRLTGSRAVNNNIEAQESHRAAAGTASSPISIGSSIETVNALESEDISAGSEDILAEQDDLARRLAAFPSNSRYAMSQDTVANFIQLNAWVQEFSEHIGVAYVPNNGSERDRLNDLLARVLHLERGDSRQRLRIWNLNEAINDYAETGGLSRRALDFTATPEQQLGSLQARLIEYGSPDPYSPRNIDELDDDLQDLVSSGRAPSSVRATAERLPIRILGDLVQIGRDHFPVVAPQSRSDTSCYVCTEEWDNARRVPARLRCGHELCSSCIAVLRMSRSRDCCPRCRGQII